MCPLQQYRWLRDGTNGAALCEPAANDLKDQAPFYRHVLHLLRDTRVEDTCLRTRVEEESNNQGGWVITAAQSLIHRLLKDTADVPSAHPSRLSLVQTFA